MKNILRSNRKSRSRGVPKGGGAINKQPRPVETVEDFKLRIAAIIRAKPEHIQVHGHHRVLRASHERRNAGEDSSHPAVPPLDGSSELAHCVAQGNTYKLT
jgi:hypothetical protein